MHSQEARNEKSQKTSKELSTIRNITNFEKFTRSNLLSSLFQYGRKIRSCVGTPIDQFRYIKIQSKTIDLSTRLWGNKYKDCGVYSPEPRAEVYCVRLNFNISKLVY